MLKISNVWEETAASTFKIYLDDGGGSFLQSVGYDYEVPNPGKE